MSRSSLLHRYVFCATGFHTLPPRRDPPGPIVAACPYCSKMIYCYGLDVRLRDGYPSLLIPDFPRVLGTATTLARIY